MVIAKAVNSTPFQQYSVLLSEELFRDSITVPILLNLITTEK